MTEAQAAPAAAGEEIMGDVADVTGSTAFTIIDTLLEEGKIVEDRATYLQSKFKELHDRVLQIYNHDNFLLKRARQARKELESEKTKVDKCGEVARSDDSTIQALKKKLASAENELSVAQEKESMLQVECLELERKKQNLTHEVEDAIAAEEARLKPQIEGLHGDIKRIGDEIEVTAGQFDKCREEREKLVAREQQITEEMERNAGIMYECKLEFSRIEREPERAKKQADIVYKANQTAHKELSSLLEKIQAQTHLINELEDKKKKLTDEQCDLWATLTTNKAGIDSKVKMLDHFLASLRDAEESALQLSNEAAELDARIQHNGAQQVAERENLNRTLRDKDEGMKLFKTLDQARADLKSEKEMFYKQHEILEREEHRLTATRRHCADELDELKRDVDILINNFLKEEISEKRCLMDKDNVQKQIEDLEADVGRLSVEEQVKRREASEFSIKREQMSRECSRNQARVSMGLNEQKIKDVVVRELRKRHDELDTKIKGLKEMYSAVKREKSAKAAMIQSASQTMSETQEKIKILENELEVLRRESQIKDQELVKKRREGHEMRQSVKNLRVDINKCRKKSEAAADHERDLKQQMKKLNTIITMTEDEMLELKKSYEDAVENRNYTGIQLIDRNDELCILYEKSNIQENTLKKGVIMLNQRNEEIRNMAIQLAHLQREIEICQNVLPQARDMEEDLAGTLQELDDEKARAEMLEHDLTDPSNTVRWRQLGKVGKAVNPNDTSKRASASASGAAAGAAAGASTGGAAATTAEGGMASTSSDATDASSDLAELHEKHRGLEQRIATVNEKLMEKDLILEEVSELSNRLRKQALNGREFTLALAIQVGDYQSNIRQKTKKMMATLSELSMVQASSIKLEMDVDTMEGQVLDAKERVEQGMPPTDNVIAKYEKEQFDKQRRREILQARRERLAKEENALQLRTTAEQRPNAYIPDSDLSIPKPYGSHQPFKPTIHAQHNIHRFCRKAEVKDLDFDA